MRQQLPKVSNAAQPFLVDPSSIMDFPGTLRPNDVWVFYSNVPKSELGPGAFFFKSECAVIRTLDLGRGSAPVLDMVKSDDPPADEGAHETKKRLLVAQISNPSADSQSAYETVAQHAKDCADRNALSAVIKQIQTSWNSGCLSLKGTFWPGRLLRESATLCSSSLLPRPLSM